jgi:hypothetical protein
MRGVFPTWASNPAGSERTVGKSRWFTKVIHLQRKTANRKLKRTARERYVKSFSHAGSPTVLQSSAVCSTYRKHLSIYIVAVQEGAVVTNPAPDTSNSTCLAPYRFLHKYLNCNHHTVRNCQDFCSNMYAILWNKLEFVLNYSTILVLFVKNCLYLRAQGGRNPYLIR